MDCLQSFSFSTSGNSNYTGGNVKTWLLGAQEYWAVDAAQSSYFDITGFKNINIHGVDVIGGITTLTSAPAGGCVVEDWRVQVIIDGQIPLVSGQIRTAPNQWAIDNSSAFAKIFELGKFSNSLKFSTPFQSVKNVGLLAIKANGSGGQTAGNINLYWNLNFVFHYTYEGENTF
jgi:hypothetical protein